MPKENCSYHIDAQDKIITIGGAWTAFARENGGEKLLAEPPIGRPIWSYIKGMSTRNIYHHLFEQVRKTGRTVRLPFRCDSPQLLRYMEMELSPGPDNAIYFQTFLVRVLDRQAVSIISHPLPRPQTIVQMCAWCSKVLVHDEWHSLEHAVWTLGLLDAAEAPPISHGICPDCAKSLNEEIKQKGLSIRKDAAETQNSS